MKRINAYILLIILSAWQPSIFANTNTGYIYPSDLQKKQMPKTQRQSYTQQPLYRMPSPAYPAYAMPQPFMQMPMPQMPTTPAFLAPMQTNFPYAAPQTAMQYPYAPPMAIPPVLRFPANQTFQQARPVYTYNKPYGRSQATQTTPYAGQYPMINPQLMNQQLKNKKPLPPFRKKPEKKKKKPWGDKRYIWPDFYTDATGDLWDDMLNAPYDMGRMPGGWRAPSLSTPDPVTVGDAVANQVPPFVDEVPNFLPFLK